MALVDIIMLVHDQASWADLAIRAVEHHTRNSYRLIIVDNASREQKTKDLLADAEKRGHTVVRLAENRSFSNGVNAGVNTGTSQFIVVLNDDAIVTEGWDSALLQDASAKHVGLVGARSNYAAGPQGDPSYLGDPPFLVFVCVALRRNVWNAVGPMDEALFDGFSGEDLDYAWRVKKAGYALKVSNAYVLHAGSRTLAATTGDAMARRRNDEKYMGRLVDKHGKEWVAQHTRVKERVLVVSFHGEEITRVEFMKHLLNLRNTGGVEFGYLQICRFPIQMARQKAAEWAIEQGYDVLVQLDDDATFPPDLLARLLSHKKDVVTALAYQRKPPHLACIFEQGPDGVLGRPLEGWEHTGLRRVDVSGYHVSATRLSVFKRMKDAGINEWFGGFERVGEDFAFSINCKKIGVQIHCDTELIAGHIGSSIVVDEEYKRRWVASQPKPG